MRSSSDGASPGFPKTAVAIGVAAAVAFSLGIGWRNYFIYRSTGRSVPLWESVAGELPIWLGWLALVPLIVQIGRRWPPVGARAARHALLHVAAALLLSAALSAFIVLARMLLPNTPSPATTELGFAGFWRQMIITVVFSFLFVYGSILGLSLAWIHYVEQQRRELRESRLEALLVQSQHEQLLTQLRPHFLFNTMHAISSLMESDVPAARRMMSRLSDLLRRTINHDSGHEATLHEELELLRQYLEIQRVRFRDRLHVEYDVAEAAQSLLVPRLILQPIVENAITHGLAPVERSVTIRIAAVCMDGALVITIADDGAGLAPPVRYGVGLGNTEARLHHLYGGAARFELEPGRPGAIATVRIPAHTASVPAP